VRRSEPAERRRREARPGILRCWTLIVPIAGDQDDGRIAYHYFMPDPQNPPMGRLDAFDVGPKKLTIQTEFFPRPNWRIETKVYLAGTLKKVYTADMTDTPEAELQRSLNAFHQAKIDEISAGLRQMKQ
jgi:hypothetical protein